MPEIEFEPLKNGVRIKLESKSRLPNSGWLETTRYQRVEEWRTREVIRVPIQVILSSPADKFKEG